MVIAEPSNIRAGASVVGRAKAVLTKQTPHSASGLAFLFLDPGKTVIPDSLLSASEEAGFWIEWRNSRLDNSKGILTNGLQNEQHVFTLRCLCRFF